MKKIFTFVALFFFVVPLGVNAASIIVGPSTKVVTAGSQFTVSIVVDTQGKYVNAVEATVNYPRDLLDVVSVSKARTFSLQTPGSPSRSGNEVFFSGGIPSPGYKGVRGGVGYITFRAKSAGTAYIKVDSGKVLLNDGKGTDVFDGVSNATIVINPSSKTETPPVVEIPPVVEAPVEVTPEILPAPVITPAPVIAPTPPPATDTIIIKISDLFNFIYILIGSIIFLITAVVILSVILLCRKSNKEKKD